MRTIEILFERTITERSSVVVEIEDGDDGREVANEMIENGTASDGDWERDETNIEVIRVRYLKKAVER